MAPSTVKSRFKWLTYNEPEGHLDDLVARLRRLPGINAGSRIGALTYKDDSTLARFDRAGYANTYRVDMARDLRLDDPCAGLESIQAAIDAKTAERIAERYGSADLLIVRHVLEHAHDPLAFLQAVRSLVKPGGHLVFEMPDSTKFIKACDYSFVWEEHITYLCAATLETLIANGGLFLSEIIVYPYPLEDSLIAVVNNERATTAGADSTAELCANGKAFARQFDDSHAHLHALFRGWRQAGKRIAVFGAGHLAAKFVNFFGLEKFIECVIDDNPNKQNLLMPGSRLPVQGSAMLDSIDVCLLSLNPESEQKVMQKYRHVVERGVAFLSIFALSQKSVYRAAPT